MSHVVDVLMPAYNAGPTIRVAVESILGQNVTDLQLHVVDDGSTDETVAVLADLAATDPRVHIHTQANEGVVDALNNGLAHCTAEFVARMDADDIAYPDRLERQLAFFRAHADVIAVSGAMRHVDADGTPTGSIGRAGSPEDADPFFVPSIEPYLIHPAMTCRRAVLVAAGGYRHVCHAEDTDLYWRLRAFGRLYNIDEIVGDYRLHANSISGGSIVNGRIMSVSSQLAALSAQRRLQGRADIAFHKDSLARYRAATTLERIVDIAVEQLEDGERTRLEEAAAAKLMELAAYRPYELEASDCAFIGKLARRGFDRLPSYNRRLLRRQIAGTAARIVATGRWRDANAMLSPAIYPGFATRAAARVGLPDALRRKLRRGSSNSPLK